MRYTGFAVCGVTFKDQALSKDGACTPLMFADLQLAARSGNNQSFHILILLYEGCCSDVSLTFNVVRYGMMCQDSKAVRPSGLDPGGSWPYRWKIRTATRADVALGHRVAARHRCGASRGHAQARPRHQRSPQDAPVTAGCAAVLFANASQVFKTHEIFCASTYY